MHTLKLGEGSVRQYETQTYPLFGPHEVFLIEFPKFNEVHLLGLTLDEIPLIPNRDEPTEPTEPTKASNNDMEDDVTEKKCEPIIITLLPDEAWEEPSDDREFDAKQEVHHVHDMYDVHIDPWHARGNRGLRSSSKRRSTTQSKLTRPHHNRRHDLRNTKENPFWDRFHPSNNDDFEDNRTWRWRECACTTYYRSARSRGGDSGFGGVNVFNRFVKRRRDLRVWN